MNKRIARLLRTNITIFSLCLVLFALAAIPFDVRLAIGEGVAAVAFFLLGRRRSKATQQSLRQYIQRFYGGMWSRDDFPRNCVVGGDINVQIGKEGNEDQTALVDTSYDFSVAGSYGVIEGNVNFTIEDGAYITGEPVYAAGIGCEIKHCVNITINGGYIKNKTEEHNA